MSATIEIVEPGLATTVQDLGRIGHYNVGIPQSGAMDGLSADMANAIVGNPSDAAVLECTYMGPKFRVSAPVRIGVAGAPVPVKVNGEERSEWQPIDLEAGDEVSFGVIQGGTRYYVAVAGGVDVPVALGSRSTYALGALGGFEGRKLEAGDELPVGDPAEATEPREIPESVRPSFPKDVEIRVVRGLYDHLLSDAGRAAFYDSTWTLTPVADRIGLRFKGPGVEWNEREQPFGRARTPRTSSTRGMPWGRSRSPAARSRSSCTATRSPAAATPWSPPSSAPTWTCSPGSLPGRRPASSRCRSTTPSPPERRCPPCARRCATEGRDLGAIVLLKVA